MTLDVESFADPAANSAGLVVTIVRYRAATNWSAVPSWAVSEQLLGSFPELEKTMESRRKTMRLVKIDKGFAPLSEFRTSLEQSCARVVALNRWRHEMQRTPVQRTGVRIGQLNSVS